MTTSTKTKSWAEIRAEIKKTFSKLSDETLDSLNESFDHLSEKVQATYGMAKDRADREIESLKQSFHKGTEEMKSEASSAMKKTGNAMKHTKKKVQRSVSHSLK